MKEGDKMVLAIDIGNTNIAIGGFCDSCEVSFVVRIATDPMKTEDEYASKIRSVLSMHNVDRSAIDGAIIASVVPPLNTIVKRAIKIAYGVDALMVGPGIKTGINIHCDHPASVGADLICACVATHFVYGSPALIVDMGTATKMMVIDRKGAFIGVSIIPGVNILVAVLSIGIITFCLSALGVKVGSIFGAKYKSKAELVGGIVLCLMGLKILLEHLGVLNF